MSRINIQTCLICHSNSLTKCFAAVDHTASGESFTIVECKECGFRFTADPPAEQDCGRYYQSQDYISHSDTSEGWVNKIYHKVRKIMLGRKEALCRVHGTAKTLLDFGSGTGYFADHMQKAGYKVMGVEMDDNAREYSRRQWGLQVVSTQDFLNGKLEEKYGYITLWHVLEHLYDPDRYMKLFNSLLDTNGRLIIAVPNFHGGEAKNYSSFWAGYDVPRHLWHFHPEAMRQFAKRNGFEVTSMAGMPFDPFYNAMLSEKYMKHSLGLLRGGLHGLMAWVRSAGKPERASSVIYTMVKAGK